MSRYGSQGVQTLGNNVSATKILIEKYKMFMNLVENKFCLCNNFSTTRWASMETFEETSRIANVSATMFPSDDCNMSYT